MKCLAVGILRDFNQANDYGSQAAEGLILKTLRTGGGEVGSRE